MIAVVLGLLPLQTALSQGNPAAAFRQMQAMMQRLNTELTNERRLHLQQQQQMTVINQRLQRLQTAVNAAAAAGDPMAKAVRSSSTQAQLDKLATQFESRSRSAQPAGTPGSEAELLPADLSGARLSGAVLQGAKLVKASLKGADLTHADLTNAVLSGASLQTAKLQGAILTGADLAKADLTGTLYDAHTRWPDGYDPQKQGALLVR
jgi:uncharacterized protein YjbI with pentapeptide repeats